MWVISTLIIAAVLAFLPASIAKRKGKSFGVWYLYGFLIWIIAIIHAISLPERHEKRKANRILVRINNGITEEININALGIHTRL